MALVDGLRHLYPGITNNQLHLRDDSDGNGPYLEWLDPSLGTPPTLAEIQAAELLYQPPSMLEDSRSQRHPTTSELQAQLISDPDRVLSYYRANLLKLKIQQVAINNDLFDEVPDGRGGYEK